MTPHVRPQILIVSNRSIFIQSIRKILTGNYFIAVVHRGEEAQKFIRKNSPVQIIIDNHLPDMSGCDLCAQLNSLPTRTNLCVIIVSSSQSSVTKERAYANGATDYFEQPVNSVEFRSKVDNWLNVFKHTKAVYKQNLLLKLKLEEKLSKINNTIMSTVKVMTQMTEVRDPYIAGHQQRVSQIAGTIARHLAIPNDDIITIRIAGALHDIGKLRIPLDILNRPGRLHKSEFEILKLHPQVGYDLLRTIDFSSPIADIVHQHHEKLDGSGYPNGLTADHILPEAKILMVADVLEAMCSHRPYRPALGFEAALAEVEKNRGIHFCPDVVDACTQLHKKKKLFF